MTSAYGGRNSEKSLFEGAWNRVNSACVGSVNHDATCVMQFADTRVNLI